MWTENSKSAHNVKILVYYVNAHQRVCLAEEDFTTQVDTITYLMFLNGLMNKVTMISGMEVIDGFYNVSTLLG